MWAWAAVTLAATSAFAAAVASAAACRWTFAICLGTKSPRPTTTATTALTTHHLRAERWTRIGGAVGRGGGRATATEAHFSHTWARAPQEGHGGRDAGSVVMAGQCLPQDGQRLRTGRVIAVVRVPL